MTISSDFFLNYCTDFTDFFNQTDILALLVLKSDLTIDICNDCFMDLIQQRKSPAGNPVSLYLLSESHTVLKNVEIGVNLSLVLNFVASDSSVLPLHCRIYKISSEKLLILGGHLMLTNDKILQKMTILSNEAFNMARDLQRKNRELEEAQAKIRVLSGIIPICSHCQGIRDDEGYWNELEQYISTHSDALFSHSICPACARKYYSDYLDDDDFQN